MSALKSNVLLKESNGFHKKTLFCLIQPMILIKNRWKVIVIDNFSGGNIKNLEGKVLGVHDGVINYTIGQRKGIKVSNKEPLYVIEINATDNEIIIGPKKALAKKIINLKDINLLGNNEEFNKETFVKVRSTGKLLKSKISIKNTTAVVNLEQNEYGISPGQACVFYSKNINGYKVLGGGWIK